jgi:geranylgeranyl diphosphate synthase type II
MAKRKIKMIKPGNKNVNMESGQQVPQEKAERERIRHCVLEYARENQFVPPLSIKELSFHTDRIINSQDIESQYRDFTTVLVGNAVWRGILATVPYDRRVLLLPQCLRRKDSCPAQMDQFGLLCEQCGQCPTGDLQDEAERLGYVVLIAEGTTVVTKLLESGQVDAVVGVSCLSALERSFPHLTDAAIPGTAIPLFRIGCNNTSADIDWIRESIHLTSNKKWEGRINLDQLRSHVSLWFEKSNLSSILELTGTRTERIACDWIVKGGKRWRPFLATAVFKAVNGLEHDIPEAMKKLAIAVECFHKASLVHDDIEDDDDSRYNMPTLHKKHGVPVALNIGDLLIGEGYRLIAECEVSAQQKVRMLTVASQGHRELCLGQGEELGWITHPVSLSSRKVLDFFRRKTSPAFEVALSLGAICGGANDNVCRVLKKFSQTLGIAYQIRDDIEDFHEKSMNNDIKAMRPSLLAAMAMENKSNPIRPEFKLMWQPEFRTEIEETIRQTVREFQLEEKAWQLFDHYKSEAIESLRPLRNHHLKSLLYRVVFKVLGRRPPLPVSESITSKHMKDPVTTTPTDAVFFTGKNKNIHIHAT